MEKESKSTRTRQVQFRMDPDKVKQLLAAIAYDDNMHSMADLFNKAADDYLNERKSEINIASKTQDGGDKND